MWEVCLQERNRRCRFFLLEDVEENRVCMLQWVCAYILLSNVICSARVCVSVCLPLEVTGIQSDCADFTFVFLAGGGSKADSLPPTKTLLKPW